jgi:hypothetical protein
MRFPILLMPVLLAGTLPAQDVSGKSCTVPTEKHAQLGHPMQMALDSASAIKESYTRSQLLGRIAEYEVCVDDFPVAASVADLAYPSGSQALSALGRATGAEADLSGVPELEKLMTHGTHSFLYGLVEGLGLGGRFAEADVYLAKIEAPEVRADAQSELIEALYKAGNKDEARRRMQQAFSEQSAQEKAKNPLEVRELEVAAKSHDWPEAHRLLGLLAAGAARRNMAALVALEEADAATPGGHEALLAASTDFDAGSDPPYVGYLIAAHLAGLHDFAAAEKAANAVRDDEWNGKAWISIASFEAEAGEMAQTKASIARIGQGELEHKLSTDAVARDMGRELVAATLTEQGRLQAALAILSECEDSGDSGGGQLQQRVDTLAASGDIAAARSLVDKKLGASVAVSEREENLAATLVRRWWVTSAPEAERWASSQRDGAIRAAAWLAIAKAAAGEKTSIRHYFINSD